ncbi:MAG: hypothetical protein ACREOO_09830 [bacterium]
MYFEEKYEDVLQNLESGIMRAYRNRPEMTDHDVMQALEALRRHYIREARKQVPVSFNLTERAQEIFEGVQLMCELRLGRSEMTTTEGESLTMGELAVSVNEIIDCVKRIERSVQRWNKSGGRKGYLNFIADFFPEGEEEEVLLHVRT